MQIQKYAPVLIPTLNRYEHLRRCVESLANNKLAKETELVIGLDYPPQEKYKEGWKKIKDYLPTIEGFGKVTILCAEENIGAVNNSNKLKSCVLGLGYNSFIFTEDDNEFSPCFLDYVNKALIKYWDDERVAAICGYSFPVDMSDYKNNVYFYHDQSAWGVALWKHKMVKMDSGYRDKVMKSNKLLMRLFNKDQRLFFYLLYMVANNLCWTDALNGIHNILNNRFVLYPKVSMCRNYGHDGSGINCGEISGYDKYSNQEIDYYLNFDLDDIIVEDCQERMLRKYFKISLHEKLSYLKQYVKYLLNKFIRKYCGK